MSELVELLKALISQHSITPIDANCQAIIGEYLTKLGFKVHSYPNPPVDNLYAQIGTGKPLFVFAGHTDVVPPGESKLWNTAPFEPTIDGNILYGRGAADMKGSIAAMLVAAKKFIKKNPDFTGSLGFLITSAEEGEHFDLGTPYVMEQLAKQGIRLDYCIVGEPSSTNRVGDIVKIGRRGSLTANVTVAGIQGHVAYPHLADNPIHNASKAISELCHYSWDEGNSYFPPTTMQISNIHSGTGAGNVIPATLEFKFNFRFSPLQTVESLKQHVEAIMRRNDLGNDTTIDWRVNGHPFLTSQGTLLDATMASIEKTTNYSPELSTTGGTSDARFIAPYDVEVIELGPVNATIHQANECVDLNELHTLASIYKHILLKLLPSLP
jgi:succinyl-diaminopimelate desuccinylase